MAKDAITLSHGSGGFDSEELTRTLFSRHFGNAVLLRLEDAATVGAAEMGGAGLAVSTDTFVVRPLAFPGGDIGKLAVCGTVNDVLMSGASPRWLTCGFVLDAGLAVGLLDRICASMAEAAREAGVLIVAGDTKVVEGGGAEPGLIVNTTGIGVFGGAGPVGPGGMRPGDRILVSGNLGDHHACILSCRMGIDNGIESDCALLTPLTDALRGVGVTPHAMRDVTRGGLATVLNELARASGVSVEIDDARVPVSAQVRAFCGIMGLDPLYMGNEGKLVCAVAEADAERALAALRLTALGQDAAIIGEVYTAGGTGAPAAAGAGAAEASQPRPPVVRRTAIGGRARLDVLYGEGLPRIC
ncbi:MAG: hydrogenase expression/formation protein HypE [Clostridiales Family XIII bacterium]|jgi:hydrogenase expression/formation protein HypE|nr:hydrogenase expression/formation protein HypE [Clostridiales Family XIII bacterium]